MNKPLEKLKFEYLVKNEFSDISKEMFYILADNMSVIAPTGNAREDDFAFWIDSAGESLQKTEREIVLIKDKGKLIGYFQYSVTEDTFKMEEIQLLPAYHGKGVFRNLYGFVLGNIRNDLDFVEANASKNNLKSIGILEKLGLSNIGLNKNGRSYHFKGEFANLISWYENK